MASAEESEVARLQFQCYAPLGHGEHLVVTGDTPVLGGDDPARGVELRTTAAAYPVWTTAAPVAVPARRVVRYRYAVVRAGAVHRFETFPSDQTRRHAVVDPASMEANADGSAGDTLVLADRVACDGLREWTDGDAAARDAADASAAAVAAASVDAGAPAPAGGVRFAGGAAVDDRGSLTLESPFGSPRGGRPTTFRAAHERRPPATPPAARPARKAAPTSPTSRHVDEQRAALAGFLGDEAPDKGTLTPSDGVVVASLFLPVLVTRGADGGLEITWDHENLLSLEAPLRVTRVGIARTPDDATDDEKEALRERLRRAPWCAIAIFLDAETFRLFYHCFCKGILWPVFHNSVEVYGEQSTPLLEFDDVYSSSRSTGGDAAGLLAAAAGSAEALTNDVKSRQGSGSSFDRYEDATDDGAFSDTGEASPPPRRVKSPPRGRVTTNDERAWHAYKRANQVFRDAVVEAYNEGDLVWIHGFQLCLLPAFVSRRLAAARVGLFLHTPFPSSEIFRTLSMRCELLRGILGADRVGFHLFEYARHFMTNCRRLLGLKHGFDARGAVVDADGRDVVVACVHAGVEPRTLSAIAGSAPGVAAVAKLREALGLEQAPRRRVLAGIDKLEKLRGLPLKLLAYERYLDRRSADSEETCLVQYALASPERAADAAKIRKACKALVDRIVEKHGRHAVVWREVAHVEVVDRLALLAVADVFWTSSVRDGLNRWPLEYVAVQYEACVGGGAFDPARAAYFDAVLARAAGCNGGAGYPCGDPCTDFVPKRPEARGAPGDAEARLAALVFPEHAPAGAADIAADDAKAHAARRATLAQKRPGALLLSDASSASRVLLGAVVGNPWQVDEIASSLERCLAMRPRERMARLAKDAKFLKRSTTGRWAYRVLADLKAVPRDEASALLATHAGLGLGFRILAMRSGFDALSADRVARAYRLAAEINEGTRVVVLDYGGTLVPDAAAANVDAVAAYAIARGGRRAPRPSDEVLGVLAALARDPRNVVFVVSGRERVHLLDGLRGPGLADLGLAAEHGFFVRWPRALRDVGPAADGAEHAGASPLDAAARLPRPPPPPGSPDGPIDDGDWDRSAPYRGGWRAVATKAMELFAARTQGTYVERHESCLVWQYRDADPDYGEMQATELEAQLQVALAPYANHVRVLRGANPSRGGYVEVRPTGVDKGATLRRILRALEAAGRPAAFALVVGDDASDEAMFRALRDSAAAGGARRAGRAFSVTVGKKPSDAESYVDAHDNLVELLEALARVSNRGTRYYSSHDFAQEYAAAAASLPEDGVAPVVGVSPPVAAGALRGASPTTLLARSVSSPAFQAANAPRRRSVPRKNSWLSFQDAFQAPGPAEVSAESSILEEGDEEQDDAAMFF